MNVTELDQQVANQKKVLLQFEKVTNLITVRLAELLSELIKAGRYSLDVDEIQGSSGGDKASWTKQLFDGFESLVAVE